MIHPTNDVLAVIAAALDAMYNSHSPHRYPGSPVISVMAEERTLELFASEFKPVLNTVVIVPAMFLTVAIRHPLCAVALPQTPVPAK